MPAAKQPDLTTYAGRFAAKLRARRIKLKLSVEDVAAQCGVVVSGWYHWENGKHSPSIAVLPQIAAALQCKIKALLPEE